MDELNNTVADLLPLAHCRLVQEVPPRGTQTDRQADRHKTGTGTERAREREQEGARGKWTEKAEPLTSMLSVELFRRWVIAVMLPPPTPVGAKQGFLHSVNGLVWAANHASSPPSTQHGIVLYSNIGL